MQWKTWLPIGVIALLAILVVGISGASTSTHPPSTASPSVAVPTTPATPATTPATQTKPAVKPALVDPAVISKQNLTAAGGNLLKSIVNIYCYPKNGGKISGASGSGVMIDPRGLILTAAHIGQYFLLTDYPKNGIADCVIRTGSPALSSYTAALVYISPSWIAANSDTLVAKAPKGTGENDFAILAITGTTTPNALPKSFTFVPLGTDTPKVGERLAIGAYAAQYLASDTIKLYLFPTIVFDSVTDRFTFGTSTVDVLSINGTAAAQEGSSGGGLVDEHNQLVGLITTSSVTGDISTHVLHAITPRHIRASFVKDSQANLDTYLASTDLKTLIFNFSTKLKQLQQLIVTSK
jgi:S1-C subfamily serine protease